MGQSAAKLALPVSARRFRDYRELKGISSMKRLTSSELRNTLLGIALTDGHIDPRGRFSLHSKQREYVEYVGEILLAIPGSHPTIKPTLHNKSGAIGYNMWTRTLPYFKYMREDVYGLRKHLLPSISRTLTPLAIAHMWMCDGYLEHQKNRKLGKVQNIGWFCLEAFPEDELVPFQKRLMEMGVDSSLVNKPWGFGKRVRIGGKSLQRLISLIFPHVIPAFAYKTTLFYKGKEYVDMSLPNAEQFVAEYATIEDIVRHS